MSYIKRETLIESIGYIPEGVISEYDAGRWDVMQKIKEAPAADVVEVVRCKDCRYFTIDDGDGLGYCTCQNIPMNFVGELYPEEYFYCFYGTRKEE